jgi:hypothetical protein
MWLGLSVTASGIISLGQKEEGQKDASEKIESNNGQQRATTNKPDNRKVPIVITI